MTPAQRIATLGRIRQVYTERGYAFVQGSYGASWGRRVAWTTAKTGLCLAGAIELVGNEQNLGRDDVTELYDAFAFVLDLPRETFALEHWNDDPARTYDDVLRAIEAAIEIERIPTGVL